MSMFNQVINGFSSDDTHTYLEVFCAVLVVYLIWMMYFTGFDARHWMGRKRAWAWAVLHMPLHFAIMLLLQGIVVSPRLPIGLVPSRRNETERRQIRGLQ